MGKNDLEKFGKRKKFMIDIPRKNMHRLRITNEMTKAKADQRHPVKINDYKKFIAQLDSAVQESLSRGTPRVRDSLVRSPLISIFTSDKSGYGSTIRK